MKKLIVLICAAVMVFSLAACGGTPKATMLETTTVESTPEPTPTPTPTPTPEPTPTPTPTPEPEPSETTKATELSAYDQAKQSILDHVDVAYIGLTPADSPMYFLASSDGSYAALVCELADETSYIKFIGNATIDEESGVLTVHDTEKGYWFGFTAEQQEDGSFFLDCGDLGQCYLEAHEPSDVVDYIVTAFQNMEDTTDDFITSVTSSSIVDEVDVAYTGITEAGGMMYFMASHDGSFAALIFESADETSYISFVGSATIDENGIMTVSDSTKGYSFRFTAEAQEDGSFFLNCGELGECYLEPDELENVLDYLSITFEDMEDVTDAYMAEYAS